MPDPWLTEDELKEHEDDVKNHPLTKEAEANKDASKKEAETAAKEKEENEQKVEDGELVRVYANGAVVGYRDAAEVSDDEKQQTDVADNPTPLSEAGVADLPADQTPEEAHEGRKARRGRAVKPKEEEKDSNEAPEDQAV